MAISIEFSHAIDILIVPESQVRQCLQWRILLQNIFLLWRCISVWVKTFETSNKCYGDRELDIEETKQ